MSKIEVPEYLVTLAHRTRPDWSESDHREYLRWVMQFELERLTVLNPIFARCESPIERMFLAAIIRDRMSQLAGDCKEGFALRCEQSERAHAIHVSVQPTVELSEKKLRPDFGLGLQFYDDEPDRIHWVYVECDGHDYHSSKQQLARDKSRDRRIAATDTHVLRFTGSEIWANAGACVDETITILYGIAESRSAA
jgi:very-short-patch-repair endonuclease